MSPEPLSTCKEIRLLRLAAGVVWSRLLKCLVVKVGDDLRRRVVEKSDLLLNT